MYNERMAIFIMRHGESLATLDPTLFGRTDPKTIPCSLWGYEQTVEAGKFLRKEIENNPELLGKKLHIFYTDYTRIEQSKTGFLNGLGKEYASSITECDLLLERDHGDFNGLDSAAQKLKNPEIYEKLHSKNFGERYFTKMPNGESIEDVTNRMNKFIEDYIKPLHLSGEAVFVITHGDNCERLEEILTNHEAMWLETGPKIPGTSDIIKVTTDFKQPGNSEKIFEGKKRPEILKDYKTEPFVKGYLKAV